MNGFDLVPKTSREQAQDRRRRDRGRSAAAAVTDAEVVITMLPAGKHVLAVWSDILADAAKPARCSSIARPSTSRAPARRTRIAREARVAVARRAGLRRRRRRQGRHADLHGRRRAEAFAKAEPILEPMGGRVVHCGEAGAGQAAKICNNMILGISMIGVGEAFVLAEKLGLSHQALFDVASTSSGPMLVADHLLPGAGAGADLARQQRLQAGLRGGADAEGPEAVAGGGAKRRRGDAPRRRSRPSSTRCSTTRAMPATIFPASSISCGSARAADVAEVDENGRPCVARHLQLSHRTSTSVRAPIAQPRAHEFPMLRPKKATADPSADAAAMLRRLGFALLFFGIPVSALFARRAIVIVAPVAVVLILLAAMLDGGARAPVDKLLAVLSSRAGLAGGILFFWAILSLLWTPFVVEASERLLNILAMVAMAMVGYLAVPDRMRSANLYILPVGVGMAALMGMIALFREGPMGEAQSLDRGMILLVLLLWPALTWLHSRGRNLEALLLAVIVALGALFAADSLALQALSIGAFAFALTAVMPAAGSRLIAGVMAGLLLLAPLLPFILEPLAAAILGPEIQRGCEPFRLARRHPVRTSAPGHRPRAGDGPARDGSSAFFRQTPHGPFCSRSGMSSDSSARWRARPCCIPR